jgi:hypothetical protein
VNNQVDDIIHHITMKELEKIGSKMISGAIKSAYGLFAKHKCARMYVYMLSWR